MQEYYLRVEALNIKNFVYDTEDLSTVRGAGLALRDAVRILPDSFAELTPVSTGASIGVFTFSAEDDGSAGKVRDKVASWLTGEGKGLGLLRYATFAVDFAANTGAFVKDQELALARNRWRQMQSPRVVLPEYDLDCRLPCEIDFVSPRTTGSNRKGTDQQGVCASVFDRHKYGRSMKRRFYELELHVHSGEQSAEAGNDHNPPVGNYVNDLDMLTADETKGNLHHKMAVIYADGNKFSRIRNEHCKSPETLKRFDDTMKRYRTGFLRELIEVIDTDSEGRRRLEVLLWGGDEFILVVPAWQGCEVLSLFYETSKAWRFEPVRGVSVPLTHASGVVFCHHNAPIYRIRMLACNLANLSKGKNGDDTPFEDLENWCSYQVLESFDHIGSDLEDYRRGMVVGGESIDDLILAGESFKKIQELALNDLAYAIPRRKLHQAVLSALTKGLEEAEDITAGFSLPDDVSKSLESAFGSGFTKWVHLRELWDYLGIPAI